MMLWNPCWLCGRWCYVQSQRHVTDMVDALKWHIDHGIHLVDLRGTVTHEIWILRFRLAALLYDCSAAFGYTRQPNQRSRGSRNREK